jgi:ribosome maturation factor RimP
VGALEEVSDLARAVADRRRLRLWDVELGGSARSSVVRVFVDSDEGVDLDTIAAVSEEISRGLDLRDPIPSRYTLEVSSPGLERALKQPQHFAACVGRRVVVKTRERLAGDSHRLDGVIVGADDDAVRVDLDGGDHDDHEVVTVPYDEIRSARTVFEWH